MLQSPPPRAVGQAPPLRHSPARSADVGALLGVELGRPVAAALRGLAKGAEALLDARRPSVVAEGLLLQQTAVGNRIAGDLLVPGDVVRAHDHAAPFAGRVRALSSASLVTLSLERAQRLDPLLTTALVAGAGASSTRLAMQHAADQCVSLDERLLILLPRLARRCGIVAPAGVLLPAGLSHWALAQLLGVRRPSFTTAAARWAAEGLLVRMPDNRWRVGDGVLARQGGPAG